MTASPVYSPERGTGTSAFRVHTTRVDFDDPALLTPGVVLWTPEFAGEMVYGAMCYMNVLVAFDGTTPRLRIGPTSDISEAMFTTTDITTPTVSGLYVTSLAGFTGSIVVVDPDPIVAVVDDGAAGAVGGATGSLEIALVTFDPRDFVVAE